METTLSTKGQVVLPNKVRQRLALRPGAKFTCRIANGSVVLTPKNPQRGTPQLVRDRLTGLIVTQGPVDGPTVTSEQVRAALADFP
jgi:AbrB family looped-hinge helix DNA binding protein